MLCQSLLPLKESVLQYKCSKLRFHAFQVPMHFIVTKAHTNTIVFYISHALATP